MTILSVTATGLVLAGTALAEPRGMGPGMKGGHGMSPGGIRDSRDGAFASLKLSSDRHEKIAEIRATSSKAMWQLMGTMHEQGHHMQGMYGVRAAWTKRRRESPSRPWRNRGR